jgi:hypothetical protein
MVTNKHFATCTDGSIISLKNVYTRELGRTAEGKIIAGVGGDCGTCGGVHKVERTIQRKANPSNHKCSDRCRSAKGHQCECECGGKYHGHNA